MAALQTTAGTDVLCVGPDRYRCRAPLLCLPVVHGRCARNGEETRGRRWRRNRVINYSKLRSYPCATFENVRPKMFGTHFKTGLFWNVSGRHFALKRIVLNHVLFSFVHNVTPNQVNYYNFTVIQNEHAYIGTATLINNIMFG